MASRKRARKTRRRRNRRRNRRKSRRRGGRRRRRRTQRGGCTKCPWMPLKANMNPNPSPVVPPGGGYEPGCTNGLRGGYYYNLSCPGGTCHPDSTVGKLWPGYDGQIEKWAEKKLSGGRRRRRRRKSRGRRKQRRRRKSRRRRNQRGGADEEPSTPVGPGVGASIKPPPMRQAMGRLVTNVRKVTPGAIKNLARAGAHRVANLKYAYYGEKAGRSPNPMDQPIADIKSNIQSLDNLSQPGFEGGVPDPEKDINIKMEPKGAPEGFATQTNKKRFG